MPGSSLQDAGRSSVDDWKLHKETIRKLYIEQDMNLKTLIETMESVHGFKMTCVHLKTSFNRWLMLARKAQYERRLKEWNFKKYHKKRKWEKIALEVTKRNQSGKGSKVYLDGELVPRKKLRKEVQRYMPSSLHNADHSPIQASSEVLIRTPSRSPSATLSASTPCIRLSRNMEEPRTTYDIPSVFHTTKWANLFKNCSFTAQNPRAHCLSINTLVASLSLGTSGCSGDTNFDKALNAMLPDDLRASLSIAGPIVTHDQAASTRLPEIITFCVANNMCDHDSDVDKWLYSSIVLRQNTKILQTILKRECAMTESLVEHLFRYSIKNKDASLLKTIVDTGFNPNEQSWICDDGKHRSALQVACNGSGLEVVRLLVQSSARTAQKRMHGTTDKLNANEIDLDLSLLRFLCHQGFDIVTPPYDGTNSLLMCAAARSEVAIVQYLLQEGSPVDYYDTCGSSALFSACRSTAARGADRTASVELLIAAGADPNKEICCGSSHRSQCKNTFGRPLETALASEDLDIARVLLQNGAELTDTMWLILFQKYDDPDYVSNATSTLRSYCRGPFEIYKEPIFPTLDPYDLRNESKRVRSGSIHALCQHSSETCYLEDFLPVIEPGMRQDCLRIALKTAMESSDIVLVTRLLQLGAEISLDALPDFLEATGREVSLYKLAALHDVLIGSLVASGDLDAALVKACRVCCTQFIEKALKARANPNVISGKEHALTALLNAAYSRHTNFIYDRQRCYDAVDRLLLAGADPNLVDEFGKSPVYHALCYSSELVFKRLERAGARIVNSNTIYHTALSAAVYSSKGEIVRYLLHTGANRNDQKAWIEVIKGNKIQLLRIMLEAGCDPNISLDRLDDFEDIQGHIMSPLTLAIYCEHQDMIDALLDAGATPNPAADERALATPMQTAAYFGNRELVERLWSLGADVNEPCSSEGHTALQYAAMQGFVGIARFLIARGADVNAPGAAYDGKSAVEGAAEYGRIDMIELLFQSGLRLTGRDKYRYMRAKELATERGFMAATRLLERLYVQHLQSRNPPQENTPPARSQDSFVGVTV